MLENSLAVATGLISFLTQHWGVVGTIIGTLIVWGIPVVSLLIEILEFAVALTPSKKDDEVVIKVRARWEKILPWLELLPHVNIPLSATALKALSLIKKIAAFLKAKKGT